MMGIADGTPAPEPTQGQAGEHPRRLRRQGSEPAHLWPHAASLRTHRVFAGTRALVLLPILQIRS